MSLGSSSFLLSYLLSSAPPPGHSSSSCMGDPRQAELCVFIVVPYKFKITNKRRRLWATGPPHSPEAARSHGLSMEKPPNSLRQYLPMQICVHICECELRSNTKARGEPRDWFLMLARNASPSPPRNAAAISPVA
eukprot:GHVU01047809.1.p2 GENE.GHVU01047809.1~~GHVU01047809.1.p2  ORF type:complete len:135 (+),score=4.65 GHVU01047809.1:1201-1605(+)